MGQEIIVISKSEDVKLNWTTDTTSITNSAINAITFVKKKHPAIIGLNFCIYSFNNASNYNIFGFRINIINPYHT